MVDSPSPRALTDRAAHGSARAFPLCLSFSASSPARTSSIPTAGWALPLRGSSASPYPRRGGAWPLVRRVLRLGPPAELETEVPPRFAQLLGTLGLGLASVLLLPGAPDRAPLRRGRPPGPSSLSPVTAWSPASPSYAVPRPPSSLG